MNKKLASYAAEQQEELENILNYWSEHMVDHLRGGFYGRISGNNELMPGAEKGLVLNARILWTFSMAFNHGKNEKYRLLAQRACDYICSYFLDKEYGGLFWSVTAEGQPENTRKQVYGQAFAIYALSEYFLASADNSALELAKELFHLLEKYAFDAANGGYMEAFTRNWQLETDLRLSDKDANEKKSMNTHLHIVEAYAALYRVWKDAFLLQQIKRLLECFEKYIYDAATGHLKLFFDEKWHSHEHIVSYGHDIEAGWLLMEAAGIICDPDLLHRTEIMALALTNAAYEALDADGGLWYEKENSKMVYEKHWWPQAEAMVGFYNAFQVTGKETYLDHSIGSWRFIQKYLLDKEQGEWHWGILQNGSLMRHEDKAGFWKCPYHNSRACMEIIRRVHSK